MSYAFIYDERLGVPLPQFDLEWDEYSDIEQAEILLRWEEIRGRIPDRIFALERIIISKQDQADVVESFVECCRLTSEIADLASAINDLHLWFRTAQDIDSKAHN